MPPCARAAPAVSRRADHPAISGYWESRSQHDDPASLLARVVFVYSWESAVLTIGFVLFALAVEALTFVVIIAALRVAAQADDLAGER